MDDERTIDCEKMDEVMLPGFRFHPTDEELVGFYLKRKIQQRPLSIELIKQLDIYKYDPWDLPKLASTGEKEWYFYCPRDRKYRNSARPNRVTGAGFWKATGTDRPIYSSEGTSKCIGLKKSLVFYRGRAAKGVKTEWMMHEFRLPSLVDPASPSRFTDKTIPAHDSWAICRIFKKTNPAVHQRANNFTHYDRRSSLSPVSPETTTSSESPNTPAAPVVPQAVVPSQQSNAPLGFIPMNIVQLGSQPPMDACPSLDFTSSYETLSSLLMLGPISCRPEDFSLPSLLTSEMTDKSPAVDLSSVLLNSAWSDHGGGFGSIHEDLDTYCGYQDCRQFDGDGLFGIPDDPIIGSLMKGPDDVGQQWDRLVDLSYGPADLNGAGAWMSNLVGWDTSELSTLFSTSTTTPTTTTKCHT